MAISDPTKLTTDAVDKAKIEIKELFDTKLELVNEKFAGRDVALAAALKSSNELVKQQNDSNTLAANKAEAAFNKQLDNLNEKIEDIKKQISELARKNYAVVGAYIIGAIGIAALVAAALIKH